LTAFSGDTLQILLSSGIGIANLEKKTLLANGLAVKLSDDLLADFATLEATNGSALFAIGGRITTYRAKPTPRLVWV
jgi:hypothetical protein